SKPNGMPSSVKNTSQAALRRCTCRQSCATTTAATVIETSIATGATTSTGSTNARSGTAMSASPNPSADRTSVAQKSTAATRKVSQLTCGMVAIELTASAGQPPGALALFEA